MANWTDERVAFYQADGGRDRLQKLWDIIKEVAYPTSHEEYTDKYGNPRKFPSLPAEWLRKWKQDYPKTTIEMPTTSEDWIGLLLVPMDLHHWYEQGGEHSVMRSFIRDAKEYGVESGLEVCDQPFIELDLSTAWNVVDELWNEIGNTYDLEYVQMGIEESGGFAFNTDIEHRFLTDRYLIKYEDDDDECDEMLVSDINELIDFVEMYREDVAEQIDDILFAHIKKIGNLKRSPKWQQEQKSLEAVDQVVNKINDYLSQRCLEGGIKAELTYQILDTEY